MAEVAKAYPAAPVAPPAVPAAGNGAAGGQPAKKDNDLIPAQLPQFHVPDVVEDRRIDSNGNTVVRRYNRGKLLGKVSNKERRKRRATTSQRPGRL